jgi:hypothetical protein
LLPLTNLGTATGKHLFEDIGQIAHEMKPVGNLPCLGRGFSRGSMQMEAAFCRCGKFLLPISCNNLLLRKARCAPWKAE